jgi:hypothetical protein
MEHHQDEYAGETIRGTDMGNQLDKSAIAAFCKATVSESRFLKPSTLGKQLVNKFGMTWKQAELAIQFLTASKQLFVTNDDRLFVDDPFSNIATTAVEILEDVEDNVDPS